MSTKALPFPKDFARRRWHSAMGIWFTLYLIFHLVTNSRAALFVSEEGGGFIDEVNLIHRLPYLPVIEIFILGMPFLIHAVLGIRYAITSASNSRRRSKDKVQLPKFGANHAYSWQRITAWILLAGVILHVVQMRFYDYPREVRIGPERAEFVGRLSMDPGLPSVAERMEVKIYTKAEIASANLDPEMMEALRYRHLNENQVMAVGSSFGEITLLTVRDTFKSFWMMGLYTIFVLAAVYHGFRGLWSFLITWGVTLTQRTQRFMKWASVGLMVVIGFLGLAAIWMTYWVTLHG